MKGLDRLDGCRYLACLVAIALAVVAATPLPATESELKAKPAETEKAKVEGDAEEPTKTVDESDASICIDADEGQTTSVNTLEDIYSLSRGNLAVLLKLSAESVAEATPAVEEVRWTEVVTKDESGTDTQTDPAKRK